eukprot:scaffold1040_cov149-Skeletonema_menzelii.AAC.4
MTSAEGALQEFVATQKRLLELELRAEEEASAANASSSVASGRDNEADRGFFLRNLDVIDTSIGLYGRTVITFGSASTEPSSNNDQNGKNASPKLLPSHRLTVGDEVAVLAKNGKGSQLQSSKKVKSIGGVICASDETSISVALFGDSKQQRTGGSKDKKKETIDNGNIDDDGEMLGGPPPYSIVPKSSAEVHRKMVLTLDNLEKQRVNHSIARDIIKAAFEPSNPNYKVDLPSARIEALEREYNLDSTNTNLDYSQKEAIIFALSSTCPISLIHGPPGTGKTTTVANLIRCAVRCLGWKVLVTAPSNVAVDNVLERIMQIEETEIKGSNKRRATKSSKSKIKAVRLGHPARIQQGIQKYSLESLVAASDGTEIVRDCRNEMNDHLRTLSDPKSRSSEKRVAYREMKSLRKEIRSREEKVVGHILRDANVVLATNVGAASSVLNRMVDGRGDPIPFDLVIIDEAAQALEASCWISLMRGKRAVLAGDHKQLPPTIKSTVNEVKNGLGETLFERLMISYEKESIGCSKMLKFQYRMHQDIANWASNAMYHGKLLSHESVRKRKLIELPQITANSSGAGNTSDGIEQSTLMLIDTTGCDMHEAVNEAGSRYNEGEAGIVISHVNSLISLGLCAQDIAVITPYNGQVELLRKQLLPIVPKLEIRSVDGFQGGEREAVVLSLVRSSDRGGRDGIGFLRDARRLNVAVTRAKRHCAVICDVETVSQDKFIKGLVDWMEENGQYLSAAEFETSEADIDYTDNKQKVPSQKKAFNKPTPIVKTAPPAGVKSEIASISQRETRITTAKSSEAKPKSQQPNLKSNNLPGSRQNINDSSASNRIEMMERINHFAETMTKGDKLSLGKDLSEYDSIVAKELACKLGLDCRGQDGELTIHIVRESKLQTIEHDPEQEETTTATTTSAFAQLCVNDGDSSSDDEEDDDCKPTDEPNNLLKQLALEREQRRKQQEHASQTKPANPSSKKSKKKKKGGQQVGGSSKQSQTKVDDDHDGLDDMAFLNAQIEKVQNSHGRKVEGGGKGYRSIVNGILLSKPTTQEKKKNTAASSQLKAKLNSKSQDRKVKKKKK